MTRASKGVTVAIDGPAGAGKSTVASEVARRLGFRLVDTGAIYRAVSYEALRTGIAWDDEEGLARLVTALQIDFSFDGEKNRIFVDGRDVSEAIRTPEISLGASQVSAWPRVRAGLLALQRQLAGRGGAVLEGRDIGTVVFPDAPVKVYLDATPQERARRRHEELRTRGTDVAYERVLEEVTRRDAQDRQRAVAPLRPAEDAMILDSTRLTVEQVIECVLAAVRAVPE